MSEENRMMPQIRFVGDIEGTMAQLINLSDNVIHEPTCEICSSQYRKEIEEAYITTQNIKDTIKIIKVKNNITINEDVIENHILNHFGQNIKELQKVEYVNRIKRLNTTELTTLDRIKLGLSALTERLVEVNSLSPNQTLSEADVQKIKCSETSKLMGTYNNLLKLQASILGEMKNSGELVSIPKDAFVKFFNNAILEAKSDVERETIKRIVDTLGALSTSLS